MSDGKEKRIRAALERALRLVTEAMDVLDANEGPPDAAEHLELARQRLYERLSTRQS
jgi:hypothetical protein